MEAFEQLLRRLPQDQALFQGVEEATRQAAILPILAHLGWDPSNIREVSPEYSVGNGRVDYCLHIGEKKAMYIEVKRFTEELDRHERQLLEYAFSDGVELAALTNGLQWWFYLPLGGGNWQQRKFLTIDIREQAPEIATRHFHDFLSRDSLSGGTALTRARAIHASHENKRQIDKTLPKAWDELFAGPDEALLALLGAKVESMCGYTPEPETLAQFVRAQYARPDTTTNDPKGRAALVSVPVRTDAVPTGTLPESREYGAIVKIDGKTFRASTVADLYTQVLKYLCDNRHIERLQAQIPYATSSRRYLLARQPVHPRGNNFLVPVEYNGYYMEAHKDYQNAIKHLGTLLSKIGINTEEIRP